MAFCRSDGLIEYGNHFRRLHLRTTNPIESTFTILFGEADVLARKIKSTASAFLSWIKMNYLRYMGVTIGKKCFISKNATIDVRRGKIIIGDYVSIAPGSFILSHTARRAEGQATRLEDNVLIFVNAVIFPGVTVGKNSIVGASAVVTKDVPPNVTVFGNPARVIWPKGNRPRN